MKERLCKGLLGDNGLQGYRRLGDYIVTHWLVIKSFQSQCSGVTANVVSLNSPMTMKHVEYIELNALAFF